MNVIFMGTPEFAVETFNVLVKKHNILAVVTQPDKPKGRGNKLTFSEVKKAAIEYNIDILQPKSAKDSDFISTLKKYNADIFVVAAYGQILPEEVLNMPKYGSINVHGSILPAYRGAAPIQRAIMDGQKETGITIMYMEKGLDCGDIISQRSLNIQYDDTYGTLSQKLAVCGAELLIETLDLIENGNFERIKQNNDLATYAHIIEREDTHIDWNKTADEIHCFVRGLFPNLGGFFILNGESIKIWKVKVLEKEFDAKNGEICAFTKKGFVVKCGFKSIEILSVQPKGKKQMDTDAYMRGHNIEKGTILK